MRRGQRQRKRRELQPGSTAANTVAILCHDANILLRDGLAPAGDSSGSSVSTLASAWRRCGGIAPNRKGQILLRSSNDRMRLRDQETVNKRLVVSDRHCLALRYWPIYHRL
jgi:hypothetical protein